MDKFINGILNFVKSILNSFFNFINSFLNYVFYVITTYPLEVICLLIVIYLVVRLVRDLIVHINVHRREIYTEINIRNQLGYIILIFGKIRIGKTTLMSALTHVIVKILRHNAYAKCEEVKSIILDLDWGDIDLLINDMYQEQVTVQDASNQIFEAYANQLSQVHKSFINREISYESLMFDYIEARYALIRNNYVYALKGQEIFCRVTNNYSITYDPEWTRWKDAWQDRDYRFPRYCVILWDEKNMDQDKKALSYNDAHKQDDGTPEFLRAFGNAGRETRYMILTAQEAKNWVTLERRLVSSIIEVRGRKKINIWSLARVLTNKMIKLVNLFYRIVIFLKFTKIRKDNYINNSNIFRRLLKRLNFVIDYLNYKCFLRFDISIYDEIENVGKRNTSTRNYCEDISLYFPTYYAWGNIDTWQLSYLDDELIKRSEHTIFEVQEGQRFLTEDEKYEYTKAYLDRTVKVDVKDNKHRSELNLPNDGDIPSAF